MRITHRQLIGWQAPPAIRMVLDTLSEGGRSDEAHSLPGEALSAMAIRAGKGIQIGE